MTKNSPSVEAIDRALAAAAPELGEDDQRFAVALLRLLAAGRPASIQAAADDTGLSTEEIEGTLSSWPAMFRDDDGSVVGFAGLANSEMPHRLRHAGVELYAWCAWDPLFLAQVVGELEVTTHDPVSGDTITYRIGEHGEISELSHPDTVLSFLRPDCAWDDDVQATFCHYVLQFTGTRSAEAWTAEHHGTFVISLEEALELARRHVARAFTAALV
jgi:alkylmercury lyase